jgi:hypothetical protein
MKKSLFRIFVASMLAIAAVGSVSAKPKDDTVVAAYPGDYIVAGGEIMVRVETVDSRKTNKMGITKTYMRESDIPAHILNGTPAPSAPPAKT